MQKSFFPKLSLLIPVLMTVVILSVLVVPQKTFSQVPCTSPGVPAGCVTSTDGNSGSDGNQSGPGGPVRLDSPFKGGETSLFGFLKSIIDNIVLPIGGVIAVLAFIYSGFLYVTAQGNESKLKDAHKALMATVIGTAVLLGSWVLANVICQTIVQLGGGAVCST